MTPQFIKLNDGWNAHPNVPQEDVEVSGTDVLLKFSLNYFIFKQFNSGEVGILRFRNCQKYCITDINDHAWYEGQCRYSELAPNWGEFFEIGGEDPLRERPNNWISLSNANVRGKHYLFYLRDSTFECIAQSWEFDSNPANALLKLQIPTVASPSGK